MRVVCKIGLIISLLPLLMGAAVYRWVDASGVVNYTQQKPEGIPSELVSTGTGHTSRSSGSSPRGEPASPARAVTGKDTEADLTDAQQRMLGDLKAAEQARQEVVAKVREANCSEARNVLGRLTADGRIRVAGDDGQQRVMPEEERQQRIDDAQRAVAVNCASTASR